MNEKLIEEAASAIHSVAESGASWGDARMADKDQHRAEARAALSVFEKALGEATVTPTDDEREDMIAFLLRDHNFEESPWGRTYTDAEIAAALRRTEVPEPNAETTHRGTFGHVWPCPLFYVGNWKRGDEEYYPAAECSNAAVCERPKPQAEPSDALNLVIHAERVGTERDDPLILELAEALRVALRRSEVPEPSAEVLGEWFTSSRGVAVAAVAPMTDRGPSVMVDGRVISPNDVAALIEFKAQGEPSDAQITAEALRKWPHDPNDVNVSSARAARRLSFLQGALWMRAALRAGGVR